MPFTLNSRLTADTHLIGELPLSRLLLMDDARYPWLILVPRIAGARELIDLDGGDRAALLDEVAAVSRVLEAVLRPDKLNVAALGNVVAQLHLHVIARYAHDAAWPQPVWGRGERVAYAAADAAARVAEWRAALKEQLA
ncbi:HIT domain-containing protein [Dokdonella sp.]|uniref:HIT domain-containing protein n=1 Tax=Dokdonella sp. TaxID=2291710 RepID=UPI001B13B461|nr:HIT domain-containing protein [Dokdonella sp.]MBO9662637.1 HIT domain-containing protein [Dokdonella sp.]